MPAPLRHPAVQFCPGDTGYLAYDPRSDRVHRLNPLATLVVELCDGRRGIEEIQRLACPAIPGATDGLVAECIEAGVSAGLLCTASPAASVLAAPAELAAQLREDGKIEAAYICQYNAAARDPRDASHWATLGELAHILGRRDDTRTAYERYLELEPDDAEVQHLLIGLRDQAPPPRASNQAIEQLYERFSSFYEANVVEELDYRAPKRIAELVRELSGDDLTALDLGCGSGLAGVELRPICSRLVGVDLSPQMVEIARGREIYDVLEVAEITDWLAGCDARFDLVFACDALIYFGDLRQVLTPAARLLEPGGLLVLSVERGEEAPFTLSDNGRYTHHPDHVREAAADAGLEVVRLEESYLRMEYGEEVVGLLAAAKLAAR